MNDTHADYSNDEAAASIEPEAADAETTRLRGRHVRPWVTVLAFAGLLTFLVVLGLALKNTQQGPVAIGQKAPPVQLTTFDGQAINTRNLAEKVVLVNFWASWCVPCEAEAPDLQAAWKAYKPGGQVVFIGVDYVDTEPEARAFLRKFGITYPNGPDLQTRISQDYRIKGVPETYILDRSGNLAKVQIGPYASLADIQAMIDPLLR